MTPEPRIWFVHSLKSREFHETITDEVSHSAIEILRDVILRSPDGFGRNFGVEYLHATVSLDMLALFKAVDETFEYRREWLERPPATLMVRPGDLTTQSLAFIDNIKCSQVRGGLLSFLESLTAIAPDQDLWFCCRLVALLIFNDRILTDLLSGRIAEQQAAKRAFDEEQWLLGWVTPLPPDEGCDST